MWVIAGVALVSERQVNHSLLTFGTCRRIRAATA